MYPWCIKKGQVDLGRSRAEVVWQNFYPEIVDHHDLIGVSSFVLYKQVLVEITIQEKTH